MISETEIKEKAREYGVPVSTIERDYAQNYLLKFLAHLDMAIKGGTGIRKVYVENYRFSDDLDFTLMRKIRRIKSEIRKSVKNANENGLNFSENIRFTDTESGLRATIYFSIVKRYSGARISIKLDITDVDKEPILLPVVQQTVFHNYSDANRLAISIKAYSLEEILAEKLRALFQRRRPRDLYDVWYFRERLSETKIKETFEKKCNLRNVNPKISYLKSYEDVFRQSWRNSLINQFKTLPDFDKIYADVVEKLKEII